MRRVVVTGRGIVSCIGNTLDEVAASLRAGRPGTAAAPDFERAGLRSRVAGRPATDALPEIRRSLRRFMSAPSFYAYHAAVAALAEAGLGEALLASPRTGLIVGSGVSAPDESAKVAEVVRERGARKVPPYAVPRVMSSSPSANLSIAFGVRGVSYSLSSACASSTHCIGHGADLIRFGRLDRAIVGGADEADALSATMFDAMGALSSGFNDRPHAASRPYDARRDGFVLGAGAGILVLEELESALARGAAIHGEVAGYGASSDGQDMVTPRVEGIADAMSAALEEAGGPVDYLNTHATSTPAGDLVELEAVRQVFGPRLPLVSSTKGLTGHALGASGVHEAIFCLLMLERGFVAGCANVEALDDGVGGVPILTAMREQRIDTAMTNSLGFGGTNASLVLRRWPARSA